MRRRLALILLLVFTASLWAVPEPSADELEAARARYAHWRLHPERLARMRQDWQKFLAQPVERREQILQLDHDLHEEPSAEQARLWNALERYTDWVANLPEPDKKAVREAPDKAVRLKLVGELRDREWMKGQSRAVRDEWAKLQGKARADFVKKLRHDERQHHREWLVAGRFWRELDSRQPLPGRLEDLLPEVRNYVHDFLKPMLNPAEKERLDKAEGAWPGFMLALIELADRHPPALPGATGPRTYPELPLAVRKLVSPKKDKEETVVPKALRAAEGQWPGFAVAVVEFLKERRDPVLPHELWPRKYQNLLPPMQHFVSDILQPALDNDEKAQLLHSEGSWPRYPQMIQKLGHAHQLQPPWHTLPDARAGWDPAPYRLQREQRVQGYPEVPGVKLRQFALYELTPDERSRLNLSASDPASLQRLTEAYFKHRQHELKKLRQADHVKGRKVALEKDDGPRP